MKYSTIKKSGWKVTHDGGAFYLTYLPGKIGESGASYEVDKEVYERALDSEVSLTQLINEFNIFRNFKKVYDIKKPPELPLRKNTPTKFYGKDFITTHEKDKYYLMYQLGRHGGGHRKIPITKEIYEDARKGDKSTSDLFKKYNLYHLDVPENDVK